MLNIFFIFIKNKFLKIINFLYVEIKTFFLGDDSIIVSFEWL
jgi:hypothetical protein